jgi:phage tail-like protein
MADNERPRESRRLEPSTAFSFSMDIGSKKEAIFTELSGLEMQTEILEYVEGGQNQYVHKLFGTIKVGNLTLKRGMVASDGEFLEWYASWFRGEVKYKNITLWMHDLQGKKLFKWEVLDAFPVKWSGPSLSSTQLAVAVESLELAHSGLVGFPGSIE